MLQSDAALDTLQILSLGDSYTIGESVDAQARWPVQLVDLLSTQGLPLAAPLIVAQTGWTGDELESALDAADHTLIRPPYALVTLLIGVNDQYRGRSVEEFQESFQRLLYRAIGYAGLEPRRLLVLSIPDWGCTPFAEQEDRLSDLVSAQIDTYNAVSRQLTETVGASYLNISDLTREAEQNRALLAADGLHPSATDYSRWAERAQRHLNKLGWPWLRP